MEISCCYVIVGKISGIEFSRENKMISLKKLIFGKICEQDYKLTFRQFPHQIFNEFLKIRLRG